MDKTIEILKALRNEFSTRVAKTETQDSDALKIANALTEALDKILQTFEAGE